MQTFFCAVEFRENRWLSCQMSQTIFSGKGDEKAEYEKAEYERIRGIERKQEMQTGNTHRLKAACVSADTESTSTGRKEG